MVSDEHRNLCMISQDRWSVLVVYHVLRLCGNDIRARYFARASTSEHSTYNVRDVLLQ